MDFENYFNFLTETRATIADEKFQGDCLSMNVYGHYTKIIKILKKNFFINLIPPVKIYMN